MAASDDDAPARPDRDDRREEREHKDREHKDREHKDREHKDRDHGDSLTETIRQRLEQLVPDLVKKTFSAGMGAVFQAEEGIRRIGRESLPEVAGYIASSADGAKDRVFDVIARETREFLSGLNVGEEIAKILTTLSFEIKTEIRFIPNSERFTGAEPDVKTSVRLKRADGDKDKDKDDDDDSGGRRSRLRFWQRDRGDGHRDANAAAAAAPAGAPTADSDEDDTGGEK
jgi:hypothetical protein